MLFNYLRLTVRVFCYLGACLGGVANVYATEYSEQQIAQQYKNSFSYFIDQSLSGEGRQSFDKMVNEVKNNIQWPDQTKKNKYLDAYERSLPFMSQIQLERDDVPKMVFLMPCLESTWQGKKGRPSSDYGYWQMVPEVINEIRGLHQASERLKNTDSNTARADAGLSTEAALIHLRRYYFYFRHVAGFTEEDAWLFSMTAFNWGVGNVKATIVAMKKDKKKKNKGKNTAVTFSSFYHYLYQLNKTNKDKIHIVAKTRSSRAALEYLPNLWNIAVLIQKKKVRLVKKS